MRLNGAKRGESDLFAAGLAGGFLTIVGAVFVAELTDKDALFLLSLATRMRPLFVFAAGAVAFTMSTAIIVALGSALVLYVPILWVKLAGGVIMLAYALLEFLEGLRIEKGVHHTETRLSTHFGRRELFTFLGTLGTLLVLDLAGDATEILTVVFVAQFDDALLVFAGAVVALVAASALETALGNRLGRVLSAKRVRNLSVAIFALLGSVIILTSGIL